MSGSKTNGFNFDFAPFGNYAIDPEKERVNGVWVPVEEVRFLCLRAGGSNTKYRRASEGALLGLRAAREKAKEAGAEEETREEFTNEFQAALRRVFSQTVVVDWEGVRDAQTGEPIEYSPEACLALFEAVPDLFDVLHDEATSRSNYLRGVVEEAKATLGKN